MAARRGQSEGMSLISSTYSDDDDEMEDVEHQEPPDRDVQGNNDAKDDEDASKDNENDERIADSVNDESPLISKDDSIIKSPRISRPLTPQQLPQLSISSPQQPVPDQLGTSRLGRLTIVDYGHDEAAMSPEAEEVVTGSTGIVMIGSRLHKGEGDMPPKTIQLMTPSTVATSRLCEQMVTAESHTMNYTVDESESNGTEEVVAVTVEVSEDNDPLNKFLPPTPIAKCSDELQGKINKFLYLRRLGKSYNAEVRNKKAYRNPDFLLHAVTYQDIDQIGSCFSKDVFNPHGYDKSDYYDEIEADMKREMERKEQENKKSQKVEFISGGTQPGVVVSVPKLNIPHQGMSTATGGLPPVPGAVDSVARDGRQNKKSKWDKVDGDSVSAAVSQAALLTAGTGYTAIMQQRRRETEDRRSSERKMDRRS